MSTVDGIDYEGVVLPGWCIKYQTHRFLPRIVGPRLVKVSMQSGLLLHAMIEALIFEPHESRDAYMYPPSLTEGSRFMCRRSGASLETGVRPDGRTVYQTQTRQAISRTDSWFRRSYPTPCAEFSVVEYVYSWTPSARTDNPRTMLSHNLN